MSQLTLQFSSTPAFSSMLIRRLTHSPFSHFDFVLEDGSLLGASDAPDCPIAASTPKGNPRGVAVRPPDYEFFSIRRRVTIDTPQAKAILDVARTQLGKPFDHAAVRLRNFISDSFRRTHWTDPTQWFCAEFGVWACESGGLWPYPLVLVSKKIVTPWDFLLLLNPFIVDIETFWSPIPGLTLCEGEM